MIAKARVCQHFFYTTYRDGLERRKINKQITCLGKKKANQLFLKVGFIFRPGGISSAAQSKNKSFAVVVTCVSTHAKSRMHRFITSGHTWAQVVYPPVFPAIFEPVD